MFSTARAQKAGAQRCTLAGKYIKKNFSYYKKINNVTTGKNLLKASLLSDMLTGSSTHPIWWLHSACVLVCTWEAGGDHCDPQCNKGEQSGIASSPGKRWEDLSSSEFFCAIDASLASSTDNYKQHCKVTTLVIQTSLYFIFAILTWASFT